MDLPLHPAIVHLPLGGAMLAVPLALGVLVLVVGFGVTRRAWLLAAGLQLLALMGAGLALRSGEELEERVEDQVDERAVHAHEEQAEAFAATLAVSTLLFVAAAFAKGRLSRLGDVGALGGAGLALAMALPTGHSGGEMVWGDTPSAGLAERHGEGDDD